MDYFWLSVFTAQSSIVEQQHWRSIQKYEKYSTPTCFFVFFDYIFVSSKVQH